MHIRQKSVCKGAEWEQIDVTGVESGEKRSEELFREFIASLKRNKLGLKGLLHTPVERSGHQSFNVALRQELDIYASIVLIKNIPGYKTWHDKEEKIREERRLNIRRAARLTKQQRIIRNIIYTRARREKDKEAKKAAQVDGGTKEKPKSHPGEGCEKKHQTKKIGAAARGGRQRKNQSEEERLIRNRWERQIQEEENKVREQSRQNILRAARLTKQQRINRNILCQRTRYERLREEKKTAQRKLDKEYEIESQLSESRMSIPFMLNPEQQPQPQVQEGQGGAKECKIDSQLSEESRMSIPFMLNPEQQPQPQVQEGQGGAKGAVPGQTDKLAVKRNDKVREQSEIS